MRSSRARAQALREARSQFEQDGVEIKILRRCDPEGRDGTKLPACFKVYLPSPNGMLQRRGPISTTVGRSPVAHPSR
jgi:hypothetical protein